MMNNAKRAAEIEASFAANAPSSVSIKFCPQCGRKALNYTWDHIVFCPSCGTEMQRQVSSNNTSDNDTNPPIINYIPIAHPRQEMALSKHVMLLYTDWDLRLFNFDIVHKANKKSWWFAGVFYFIAIIMIGIYLIVDIHIAVLIIGIIIGAGGCLTCNYDYESKFQSQASRKGYTYWCYDISDKYIKMCVIDRQTKNSEIVNNITHIDSFVDNVKYDPDSKEGICINHSKINEKTKAEYFNVVYDEPVGNDFFQELIEKLQICVEAVKQFGLNNIELEYKRKYAPW